MTPRGSRPYAGAADLRRMEEALAAAYRSTSLRVGDLSWLSREHSHRELALDIRLWEDDRGRLVAWTWFRPNGEFNVFVTPGEGHDALFDELLAVVEEAARAAVTAGDPPVGLATYGIDPARSAEDRGLEAALRRAGFGVDPSTSGALTRPLDDVPAPVVPAGYRLGWVETRARLLGRVEAHRAAFAPSELTAKKYERVQRTWCYRPELDRIVLTDADKVVAFCTAWLDEANAAGLLEPVGTAPGHRRRGLARAVCTDALRALQGAGARRAQVGFGSAAGYATYSSIGFELLGADLSFWRDPAPA